MKNATPLPARTHQITSYRSPVSLLFLQRFAGSHEIDKRAELVSREKSINLIDFESVPCCIDQWNGASLTDNSTKIAQYDVAKGGAQTATAKLD
jgi:hypothetical protein